MRSRSYSGTTARGATLILVPVWWLWHFQFLVTDSAVEFGDPVLWITYGAYLVEVACVAIVLTWLYNRSGGSLLIVIVWHAVYNFASVPGAIAFLITTIVIDNRVVGGVPGVQSVVLVHLETRATLHGRRSVLGGLHPQRGFTKVVFP